MVIIPADSFNMVVAVGNRIVVSMQRYLFLSVLLPYQYNGGVWNHASASTCIEILHLNIQQQNPFPEVMSKLLWTIKTVIHCDQFSNELHVFLQWKLVPVKTGMSVESSNLFQGYVSLSAKWLYRMFC